MHKFIETLFGAAILHFMWRAGHPKPRRRRRR